MRHRQLNSGFSLLEFTIALVISSFLGAVGISLLLSISSYQNNALGASGGESLRAALTAVFNNSVTCAGALKPPSGNPTVFDAALAAADTGLPLSISLDHGGTIIRSPDPATQTITPVFLPNYHIYNYYLALKKAVKVGQDPAIPANSVYVGTVTMLNGWARQSEAGSSLMGMDEQVVGVLRFSVSPANLIDTCETTLTSDDACKMMGGTTAPPGWPIGCNVAAYCPKGKIFIGHDSVTGLPRCVDSVSKCGTGQGLAFIDGGGVQCRNP